MAQFHDRIKETSTTTGTGAYNLGGASSGFKTFASVLTDQQEFDYGVTAVGSSNWENGLGRYNSSTNTITRVTIHSSSNGGSTVSWGNEVKAIYMTVNAPTFRAFQDDAVTYALLFG